MEERKNNISPLNKKSRISGMSDWEVQQVQDRIYHMREQKRLRDEQAERAPVVESIKENKLLSLGRDDFQRRLEALSQKRPRREDDYDGPTVPPVPRPEDKYTHRCPDCGYMVNTTDIHGWKRREVPNSYDVKPEPCPTCSPIVKRYQNAKRARKWVQDLVHARIFTDTCNLPDDADGWTFAEFEFLTGADTEARDMVLQFVNGSIKNLFLHGETGVCKTGLAVSAIHELVAHGTDCLMLPMKQYLDLLREDNARSKRGEEPTHIKQITRGVEVLLIDDLGVERITETGFAVEETQGLIEDRHAMGLRTIITSNMNLYGLKEYWHMEKYEKYGFQPGARIVSRIQGWYKVVQVNGIDQRIGE
jgi:DNA replication protein DnaC